MMTSGGKSDFRLLFITRVARLFAYGFLSVILALYLEEIGLGERKIGLLLSLTLIGDVAISLWITTSADRIGRRRMLMLGAALMFLAGLVFASTGNFLLLTLAAIIGVISPSGNEVGPFLPIEQAGLTQLVSDRKRTSVFAWYNLSGSFATATGSLACGGLVYLLQRGGFAVVDSYRAVVILYALFGLALMGLFWSLTPHIEAAVANRVDRPKLFLGLHRSSRVVLKLSGLFSLDAFAGGFVIQSMVAYWFHIRFGVAPATLGSIFFGANVLAGISALSAAKLASKIGLINTMVFTHIPSNLLLMLVPLMPNLPLAILVLLVRFSISQMDVPTRQSYTMAVVSPDERSAASGVTTVARSVGASVSPALAGILLAQPGLLGIPFFIAGGLKIVYDLLIYRNFKALKPTEEA